jgi:hypothetical protein
MNTTKFDERERGYVPMFGMTKKQFLKRSSKTLDKVGNHAILIRGLIVREKEGSIDNNNAYKQTRFIMDGITSTFFDYENINPPSNCNSLHLKILHSLIILQDVTSANYDFITLSREGGSVSDHNKLEEAENLLDKFRSEFRPLTIEVDNHLNKY